MFEKKTLPLLSRRSFGLRLLHQLWVVLTATLVSLVMGVLGYHYFESLSWLDALLNASMILRGMGPVDTLHTFGGKLFASFYALYSGFFLIACGGVLLAPLFHRMLHHFHQPE